MKNTLRKSKVRRNYRKSVKFIAKDPVQSHNFNNNPRKLDAGIEQFGLNTTYPPKQVWMTSAGVLTSVLAFLLSFIAAYFYVKVRGQNAF